MQLAILCVRARVHLFALCNWSQERKVKKRGMGRCVRQASRATAATLRRTPPSRLLLLAHREERRSANLVLPLFKLAVNEWTREHVAAAAKVRSLWEQFLRYFTTDCNQNSPLIGFLHVRGVVCINGHRGKRENRDETADKVESRTPTVILRRYANRQPPFAYFIKTAR
jgi:hypothetical protein